MAYNEDLAQLIREELLGMPGFVEKKMFGGVGFLLGGNMACGVNKDELIVRVGPDEHENALSQPHVRVFDMTGKPMQGWIMVSPDGYTSDQDLKKWVQLGVAFARSLPPK